MTIPENPRIEQAYIRIDYHVSETDKKDIEEQGIEVPEEVVEKKTEVSQLQPYFDLAVLKEVAEEDILETQRHTWEQSVYWIIPDAQMKRIEYTMWRRNQFAKVFRLGTAPLFGMDGEKVLYGYMDGLLYTKDGKRIMLASDAEPRLFTYSPAYAHVGKPSMESTHCSQIGYRY